MSPIWRLATLVPAWPTEPHRSGPAMAIITLLVLSPPTQDYKWGPMVKLGPHLLTVILPQSKFGFSFCGVLANNEGEELFPLIQEEAFDIVYLSSASLEQKGASDEPGNITFVSARDTHWGGGNYSHYVTCNSL